MRQLKLSLDKALDTETDAGKVLDILKAISKIDITIDLLRSTLIGKSLANAHKKFKGDECGKFAESLVVKLKGVASAAKKATGSVCPGSAPGKVGEH